MGVPLESRRSTGMGGVPEELGMAGVAVREDDGDRDGDLGGIVDDVLGRNG